MFVVKEDLGSLEPRRAVLEILQNAAKKNGITTTKRLVYLNSFVNYLQVPKNRGNTGQDLLGFKVVDICVCLRVSVAHEVPVVRAAALRAFRYLITNESDLRAVIATDIPILVVRALDIVLNNTGERIQAVRFCQKILSINSGIQHFPVSIIRALIAIGFDGFLERDKLHRASLSLLCQLAILTPTVFIDCGGVRVLLHNLLTCTSSMVLEAIVASLLFLLNIHETRIKSCLNLNTLVAPLTDIHFNHGGSEPSNSDPDEREISYRCSQISITTVLRSWNGVLHFCQSPNSGLRAVIEALYIEQLEIRKTILDLICDIVGLKFPKWTDEVTVALSAVDPSQSKETWTLQEGFVVEEALAVLPHLAITTPNITTNHTALLMSCFAREGLFDALVEVIITSDTFISVRATVLLGELLSLANRLIPAECFDPSQCIPSLIKLAMSPNLNNSRLRNDRLPLSTSATAHLQQQKAMEAVTILSALHRIKTKTPLPSSVFLQMQASRAGLRRNHHDGFVDRLGEVQLSRILRKNLEYNPSKLLKETFVLNSKDPFTWQWETICTILKWRPEQLRKVDDSSWRAFLRKLIDFFKPSTNIFARTDLGCEHASLFVKAGCSLVELLSDDVHNFGATLLLNELLQDFLIHLDNLLHHIDNPVLSQWNPIRLETSLTQTYFLFIGKLTESVNGFKFLESAMIPRRLVELINRAQHEHYIKLIISSLSYCEDFSRMILKSALTSLFTPSRQYATKFLRVLVRVKPPDFSKWGIELLVHQLEDKDTSVSLQALEVLEEAIHDKMFLESLIAIRPTLTHMGDRGLLLLICFLSLPSGYKYLNEANFLRIEIEKWRTTFNKRYVELIEVLVRDSISSLRRGEDGLYPRRRSKNQEHIRLSDLYVPPHLYGQLAKHKPGLDMLIEFGGLRNLIKIVQAKKCQTPHQVADLKAALWALSHLSAAEEALPILNNSEILKTMVTLAYECPVLSVRHTVFHCLCIICSSQFGAESLRKYNWFAMPRNHHEIYPIWDEILPNRISTSNRFPDLESESEMDLMEKSSLNSITDVNEDSQNEFISGEVTQNICNNTQTFRSNSPMVFPDACEINNFNTTLDNPSRKRSQSISETSSYKQIVPACSSDDKFSTNKDSFVGLNLNNSVQSQLQGANVGGFPSSLRNENNSVDSAEIYPKLDRINWLAGDKISQNLLGRSAFTSSSFSANKLSSPKRHEFETFVTRPPESTELTQLSCPCSITDIHPSSLPTVTGADSFQAGGESSNYLVGPRGSISISRMPIESDTDFYQPHPSQHHRMSLRWKQTSKLDSKSVLSPRDLFNASKLKRFGSSTTSLSTQSIRSNPEGYVTRGPYYMGLCLPRDISKLLQMEPNLADESISIEDSSLCVGIPNMNTSRILNDHDGLLLSSGVSIKVGVTEADDSHGIKTTSLGDSKILIIREILRISTNLISNVGVHSNEQSLLSLKQKYPSIFQNLNAFTEICVLLSQHNIRLPVRRFLQELFSDFVFEKFHETAEIRSQEMMASFLDDKGT